MESSSERRAAALKRRLDALHFTEPLNPESVPLVEHILTELIRTTDGFKHLKQSHEQLRSQLPSAEEAIEYPVLTGHRVAQFSTSKEEEAEHTPGPLFKPAEEPGHTLKEEETEYPIPVLSSFRPAAEEPRRTPKGETAEYPVLSSFRPTATEEPRRTPKAKAEDYSLNSRSMRRPEGTSRDPTLERVLAENQRLQRENSHYQTQVEKLMIDIRLQHDSERTLQTQLFTLKQSVDNRTIHRTVGTEDPYALMTKVSAMDAQKRINENEIANLKFELERTNRLKTAIDGQVQFLKSEIVRLKSELEAETNSRIKFLTSYETAVRECDFLRQENASLKSQVDLQRAEILEADRKQQDLSVQMASTGDRVRALERDYQVLSQTHAQTLSQSVRVEQLNSSLVRDTRELKTYELRYMESQREVVSLQTLLSAKEREADERRQEVMRLEQGVSVKEQELGETRSNVDTLQRQLIVISQEKELYEQRSESFSKRVTQLESELKEIEARYHRSQQDLSSQADQIASLQLKLDQLGQIYEKAEADSKHYRSLCLQLTESEKSVREKLRASEHRMQNISIQSMDDKSQLEKTHGVLQRQQRLYEEGQDQVFKLSQQNQQLEALVSELEAVRDDLAARLDQASEARRMAEIAAQRLENDMKSLRDLLNLREKELRQVQESFQRDSQEVAYLRKMLNEQTDANQQLTLSLRNKETELSLTSERLISFQRLSEELKASKASEAALHASIDRLEEQLYRAEQDRDRLKQTYENVTRSEQVSQQLLKTMEREKEGLMHTCQKALDENDRLSQSIGFTRAEQQEMYSKVQTFEQRFREQEDLIARYRAHIQSLEAEQSTRRPIEEKLTRSGSNKDLVAVYSDLEAERLKIDRLESLLEEQKRVNADLRSDLANAHDSTQTLKKDADPRDQILGLEMEVMRLRDEVGKAKHSQFRSDSKLRDLERRTTSLRAEPEA